MNIGSTYLLRDFVLGLVSLLRRGDEHQKVRYAKGNVREPRTSARSMKKLEISCRGSPTGLGGATLHAVFSSTKSRKRDEDF